MILFANNSSAASATLIADAGTNGGTGRGNPIHGGFYRWHIAHRSQWHAGHQLTSSPRRISGINRRKRPCFPRTKQSDSGQQQWVAIYNGPGRSDDNAQGIVVDGLGNVYVTGENVGRRTGYDDATIKYVQNPTPTPLPH